MPLEWWGRDEKFFLAVRCVGVSIQLPSFPRPPAFPHILLLGKVGLWPPWLSWNIQFLCPDF